MTVFLLNSQLFNSSKKMGVFTSVWLHRKENSTSDVSLWCALPKRKGTTKVSLNPKGSPKLRSPETLGFIQTELVQTSLELNAGSKSLLNLKSFLIIFYLSVGTANLGTEPWNILYKVGFLFFYPRFAFLKYSYSTF